jgi:hypothetical protein
MSSLFGWSYHRSHYPFRAREGALTTVNRKPARTLFCFNGPFGENAHEIVLQISDHDYQRYVTNKADTDNLIAWNEIGSFVEVTDVTTNKKWMIASAPCGAQCHCAAVAVRPV